ncbi:MAG: AAA family ATPase [Dysgonomonas sp.]
MELKESTKQNLPIKMALTGLSGSGKSMSALLIAKGLCNGQLNDVAVIDSENSIQLYSHMGDFKVLNLTAPYSVDRYLAAIDVCEKAGAKCIIIDSISQQWSYLLQLHASLIGNSFVNWQRVSPLHQKFIDKLLHSPCHIICTIRSKTNYVIKTMDGKTVVDKVGTKPIQRPEIVYEFSLVLDINQEHLAKVVKNRTGLFNETPFMITEETGKKLLEWSNSTTKSVNNSITNLNINNHGNNTVKAG